jgi:hypothetical protein
MLVNFMIALLTGRGAVLSTYELCAEPPLDISITRIMDISFTKKLSTALEGECKSRPKQGQMGHMLSEIEF